MPTKRTRFKREPQAQRPAPGTIEAMLSLPLPVGANRFLTSAAPPEWAERWRKWGDLALARWTRAHPGTRPLLWWRFAAPSPRLVIGNGGTLRIEAEAAYLRRLDLLAARELRRLSERDFDPMPCPQDPVDTCVTNVARVATKHNDH